MDAGYPAGPVTVTSKQPERKAFTIFSTAVIFVGTAAVVYSLFQLIRHPSDYQWLILAGLCALTSSLNLKIPGFPAQIKAGTVFYFATVMLYGPHTGVLTAALEGWMAPVGGVNDRHRLRLAALGISAMALPATIGGYVFYWLIRRGSLSDGLPVPLWDLVLPVGVLGLLYYSLSFAIHTALVALHSHQGFLSIRKCDFFWNSLSHLALAALALLAAVNTVAFGPGLVVMVALVILAAFCTYRFYLDKLLRLNRLYLDTLESLSVAIDAKDQVTHGHVLRVQTLARGLAVAMGLRDEEKLRWIEAAALLHDIGKLAVPEYILNKPGKLTSAELKKVMAHSAVGSDILSSIKFPCDVARDVRHHHEKWDGSGYPDGLKGNDIPVGARILAIADTFDALTSDRPYRPAMTREDALATLRAKAGTHYDPEMVLKFEGIVGGLIEDTGGGHAEHAASRGTGAADTGWPRQETPDDRSNDNRVFQDLVSTHREVSALYDLAQTLGNTLNLEETLPIIAAKIARLIPSTTCVIYLLDTDKGILTAEHVSGANIEAFKGYSMEFGQNLSGWVAANNHAAVNADPIFDLLPLRPVLTADLKNALVYPLYRDATCLGVISLYGTEDDVFTDDHLRVLEVVAKQAAKAIHNAMKYEETQVDALTDRLTALPNLRYLDLYFEREIEKAMRFRFPLVVMAMDLDRFKDVNDNFGHHVGDMMLLEVAKVLNRNVRSTDVVIRYGGDEFVAVVSRTTSEEARGLAKRIQRDVSAIRLEFRPGQFAQVGISIGLACFPEDGDELEVLLDKADMAMYQDKEGRSCSFGGSGRTLGLVHPTKDQRAG